jgi:hypothetical protein
VQVTRLLTTLICACFLHASVVLSAAGEFAQAERLARQQQHSLEDIFRQTLLCGRSVPEIQELENEIRKIPQSLPHASQIEKLFEILGQFLSERKMPIIGGCHPGSVEWAIDPSKLAVLASGNQKAISQLEQLGGTIRVTEDELAKWHYFLASLTGFDSARGKNHLERAHKLYSEWYSLRTGDEEDPIYHQMLQQQGVERPKWTILITTQDNCGYGTEFSIVPNQIPSDQENWLRILLSLAFTCCEIGDERAEEISLEDVKRMVEDSRFKSWAGGETTEIVDSLVGNYAQVTRLIAGVVSDEHLQSTVMRNYKHNQEKLQKLILDRYQMRKRSVIGQNC